MSEIKIPKTGRVFCSICQEQVTAPPFIASKPRRGSVIYVHARCFEEEQKEMKKLKEDKK